MSHMRPSPRPTGETRALHVKRFDDATGAQLLHHQLSLDAIWDRGEKYIGQRGRVSMGTSSDSVSM